jgi:hypothetical protein
MKKINLKSDELTTKREKKRSGGTSLALGVILLLISLSTYGILMVMNQKVKSQVEDVQSDIASIKKKLDSDDFTELYDFQSRLYEIESVLTGKKSQYEMLETIAAFTLPPIKFTSLENTEKQGVSEIKATVTAPDHYTLSQQLEAYSLMDGVSGVALASSEQKEGAVEAILTMDMVGSGATQEQQ